MGRSRKRLNPHTVYDFVDRLALGLRAWAMSLSAHARIDRRNDMPEPLDRFSTVALIAYRLSIVACLATIALTLIVMKPRVEISGSVESPLHVDANVSGKVGADVFK